MNVKILVEFEIGSEQGELDEATAKAAASEAAYHYLSFTNTGQDVQEKVRVHVDGFGECEVALGEEHD